MSLSIKGLDKVAVLKALWISQKSADLFGGRDTHHFDDKEAKVAIQRGKIDYFAGRNIKMDLRHDSITNTQYFDRDSHITAKEVIADMRAGTRDEKLASLERNKQSLVRQAQLLDKAKYESEEERKEFMVPLYHEILDATMSISDYKCNLKKKKEDVKIKD